MLLEYGIGKQSPNWHVVETKAPMYARVYYVLDGNTIYQSGAHTQVLQKNQVYIFPVHTPYEMTTDPSAPLECMHLHLDLHTADLSHLISISLEEDQEMRHLIQVIQDAVEAQYPMSYLEILAQSFEKLCLLKKLFGMVDSDTKHYIDILRKTYRTNIPVSQIAVSLGYSTENFIRVFKKKLGISPHQYAISLRMSDAVRMLSSNATLEEIAISVGYADGSSFSNAFRRYYGISPSVYREHYAGNI